MPAMPYPEDAASENRTPEISIAQLNSTLLSTNPGFLLDVRTSAEFLEARIPFVNRQISHHVISAYHDLIPADKSEPIYVVCRSGRRSADVTDYLRSCGYINAFNVTGGTLAWIEAGFETISGPIGSGNGETKK
jgi:rhodanese-related sulfurtransferase